MSRLKGLTWKHDRGLAPLVATAQEYTNEHPEVSIDWQDRSLHEFGDVSVAGVAEDYHMIVIDHPFMGEVARDQFLLPLDEYIDPAILSTLRGQSVGASHDTYYYADHQWALAIDAASQVSGYRVDLLAAAGVSVPGTWGDVLELAKLRPGFVTAALLPLDSMMCFFSLCASLGYPALSASSSHLADTTVGEEALILLRNLARSSVKEAFSSNPIAIWERMSSTNDIGYCPLAFGYSNYARADYRRYRLAFTNVPRASFGVPVGATLGGAGIAITRHCTDIPAALTYATWIASAQCQRTLYVRSGGQPGNRVAWTDAEANQLTGGFFESTMATLDEAYVRPRFPGFVDLQTAAAQIVWRFIQADSSPALALREMNGLFRAFQASERGESDKGDPYGK